MSEQRTDKNVKNKIFSDPSDIIAVKPAFVLFFSIHLHDAFNGFKKSFSGIEPLQSEQSDKYLAQFTEFESQLLGKVFIGRQRMKRYPLGRIKLAGLKQDKSLHLPSHADVYLLSHKSGIALWEVWLPMPNQPFDVSNWIGWLNEDAKNNIFAQLWQVLSPVNKNITGKSTRSGLYFPLIILRATKHPLRMVVDRYSPDIIHLLYLDHSLRPLKQKLIEEELGRDYCTREDGLTLLGRRSGLDIHGHEDKNEGANDEGLPPRSSMPFLITLELLLIEHAVLIHLYEQLSRHVPRSVDELLVIKQNVLDELEEYSGAITNATRFSDLVTSDGEYLFGLDNLYDAVVNRLDVISFEITTRYQNSMTLLQFWLTVVFGATEIGFIASGIATWYYDTGLGLVLAWTIGITVVSGLILILLLRGKLK